MNTQKYFQFILLTLTLGACGRARFAIHDGADKGGDVSTFGDGGDKQTICDPFAKENIIDPSYGLKGSLYYLDSTQPRYSLSTDYVASGHEVNADLFMSRLYVPTRAFTAGFESEDGSGALKDNNGNLLMEYFGLNLDSTLTLGAHDPVGKYQLALLADDGASMRIQNADGSWQTIVNDEGAHAARFACSTSSVTMDSASKIKMNLTYFQGPRMHIALTLMWRPWPTNSADLNDPLCGKSGVGLFFDSTKTPSEPQQAYKDLLSRGWRPLNADNFLLNEGSNKCSK